MKNLKVLFILVASMVLLILVVFVFKKPKPFDDMITNNSSTKLKILAASSLKGVLTELESSFKEQNKNVKLEYHYAGSGTLEKQIEEGSGAGGSSDIFISADKRYIDKLVEKKLAEKNEIKNIIGNKLVMITNEAGSKKVSSVFDLVRKEIGSICIGSPDSVSVGTYAMETLNYYNLWALVNKKLIYVKDAAQVINNVKSSNAEIGFAYASDALNVSGVKIMQVITDAAYRKIVYEGAVLSTTKEKELSKKYLEFLSSEKAMEIFGKHGFSSIK